ncbi:MAG: hypothetical protein WCO90_06300 [Planctomycetota bacterium]
MTAAGYITDVAYIPGFYPHMAPVAMRHVAALNGLVPPRIADGFRYLELGCGLGRSLTTLARSTSDWYTGGDRCGGPQNRSRPCQKNARMYTYGAILTEVAHDADD